MLFQFNIERQAENTPPKFTVPVVNEKETSEI